MSKRVTYSLGDLARHTGAELVGDPTIAVDHVATLEDADAGAISFLANSRYRKYLADTSASAVILSPDDRGACPIAALVTPNPYLAFAKVAQLLAPADAPQPGIHPTAVVHSQAQVAPNAAIGPHAVIGERARVGQGTIIGAGTVVGKAAVIGDHCQVAANVTIGDHVLVGNRVILHGGVVLGADGFGFANDHGTWVKVPQTGTVRIGDDVEIGANSCVDRGALGDTIIDNGVKIDNLCQVGHNTRIGAHTAIASSTAIAGSVLVGCRCMIGGAVAIAGHLSIVDDVVITGMTGVSHSIRERGVYSGSPLMLPNREWRRNTVRSGQLDDMHRRLRSLEAELADIKSRLEKEE